MVNQLFVVHADLGAAKNVVKNILMLSDEVYFPFDVRNRLEFFKKEIYNPRPLDTWFDAEYRLKDYPKFGIDFVLGDANVEQIVNLPDEMRHQLTKTHYALDLFNKSQVDNVIDLPWVRFICIYPKTDLALRWQIRAYLSKKSIEDMHNFTYIDVADKQKHIDQWGMESWTKVNLYNFYQAALDHIKKLESMAWPSIELEQVLNPEYWANLIESLRQYFSIHIDTNQAIELLTAWSSLHWPLSQTRDWEHDDIFDGSRSEKSDQMIRTHSCQQ